MLVIVVDTCMCFFPCVIFVVLAMKCEYFDMFKWLLLWLYDYIYDTCKLCFYYLLEIVSNHYCLSCVVLNAFVTKCEGLTYYNTVTFVYFCLMKKALYSLHFIAFRCQKLNVDPTFKLYSFLLLVHLLLTSATFICGFNCICECFDVLNCFLCLLKYLHCSLILFMEFVLQNYHYHSV